MELSREHRFPRIVHPALGLSPGLCCCNTRGDISTLNDLGRFANAEYRMEPRLTIFNRFAPSVSACLGIIRYLTPPRCVIQVGAENGVAARRCWKDLAVDRLLIIEANPTEADQISAAVTEVPDCEVVCALLGADRLESAPFFVASHRPASGCVAVEQLRALWPNVHVLENLQVPQRRLDELLDTAVDERSAQANWLVINCFPVLPILVGAGRYLDQIDVLCARVILDPEVIALDGGSVAELTAFLAVQGFRQVAVLESLHPALGDAIYVRDLRAYYEPRVLVLECEAKSLRLGFEEQRVLAADRDVQIETLIQERNAQATLLAEQKHELLQLVGMRQEESKLIAELSRQLEDANQACTEQARLAVERLTKIQELTQRLAEKTKKLSDFETQVQHAQETAIKQANVAKEKQTALEQCLKANAAQAVHISRLESERGELERRQDWLDQEMVKAEAQLELIKDVLLRQPQA
jgi:hypothetical protein